MISDGRLTPTHGRFLCSFADYPDAVTALADGAITHSLRVQQLKSGALPWQTTNSLLDGGKAVRVDYRLTETCKDCPFAAFVPGGYCLKPDHHRELVEIKNFQEAEAKEEARRRKQEAQEAANRASREADYARKHPALPGGIVAEWVGEGRDLAEARDATEAQELDAPTTSAAPEAPPATAPARPGLPLLRDLPYGSYKELSNWIQIPSGCTSDCTCRGLAVDGAGKTVKVCTKPRRFDGLARFDQNREAELKKKRRKEVLEALLLTLRAVNVADEKSLEQETKLALAVDALLVEASKEIREGIAKNQGLGDRLPLDDYPAFGSWDTKPEPIRRRLDALCGLSAETLIAVAAEVVVRRDLTAQSGNEYSESPRQGHKAEWLHSRRYPDRAAGDPPAKSIIPAGAGPGGGDDPGEGDEDETEGFRCATCEDLLPEGVFDSALPADVPDGWLPDAPVRMTTGSC